MEGKQRYSFSSFLTSPLDWVGGQHHAVATMPLRTGMVHPTASLDKHGEESISSPAPAIWGCKHWTIPSRYMDSWPHYRCKTLNPIPPPDENTKFQTNCQDWPFNAKPKEDIGDKTAYNVNGYVLGKSGNLSDMNRMAILFLPNPLKQVKKERKNLYWIEIQR